MKLRKEDIDDNKQDRGEVYAPEGELLNQLHLRLDPIIAEYQRENKTDQQLAVRYADGSVFRERRVIRHYVEPRGHRITLNTVDGPLLAGTKVGQNPSTAPYDDRFSVSIRVEAPAQHGYAATPDGEITVPPTEAKYERYRVVEDQDGPHIYGYPREGKGHSLDPAGAERLLWMVQESTPVSTEG